VDVDLQRLNGRPRRFRAPQRVDERLAGDDLVRAQQQQREQGALLRPAERERAAVYDGLDRTKNLELRDLETPLKTTPSGS
jgi:hypothetical protein